MRALKASKADKATWQPEVEILLKLKKQLATIPVAAASPAISTTTSVADCERAIAAQGEKVRALKASKADKATWQPEVEILLKLKKQLAALTIDDATAPAATAESGKKNKKKK